MQSKGKRETTDELLARSFKELLCKLPMEKITKNGGASRLIVGRTRKEERKK